MTHRAVRLSNTTLATAIAGCDSHPVLEVLLLKFLSEETLFPTAKTHFGWFVQTERLKLVLTLIGFQILYHLIKRRHMTCTSVANNVAMLFRERERESFNFGA